MNRFLAAALSLLIAFPAVALDIRISPTPGAVPGISDGKPLQNDTIAINRADGKLFIRDTDGSAFGADLPQIDGSGYLKWRGRPAIGRYQGGKFISQPDAVQTPVLTLPLSDQGSKGDISGMSSFTRGADGFTRPIYEWFSDRANVRGFPGADLSAKYARACASLPASGGTIYIPGDAWISNDKLSCVGKSINVDGDGPGVTYIQFTSAAPGKAGFEFAPGDATRPITVSDLSIITAVDQVNGNTALTLRYPSSISNIFKGPRVTNVEIAGTGNNATYWAKGIDAYNTWGFDFSGNHIRGKDVGVVNSFPAANMGAAISVTGESGGGCSDGKVQNNNVFFARYGGYVSGDCEGIHWTDNTGVALGEGITWPDGKGYPGFFVARNHFNTFTKGVSFAGVVQGTIHDNLFYKWQRSNQDWEGVALVPFVSGGTTYAANDNQVHNNTFVGYAGGGSDGGTAVGINATGSDGNGLRSNHFISTNWPFDFGGSSTANTVADNSAVQTVNGWQKQGATSTISRNNTPVVVGTDQYFVPITSGSFNVGAWFQRVFLTANPSAAATITDLTNAEAGRQITIIAQDANTTIKNSNRINLKGLADLKLVLYGSVTLLYTGVQWQEIGRSQ